MKKYFSILVLSFLFISNTSLALAADSWSWKADHFEITTNPASVKAWEAIDLTVKVVDSSWSPVKDYDGTIYITVDNDTKATVPYSDWYTFVPADLWAKTFSKGLSFTKEGSMKVVVMDIDNENLEWSVDVNVWGGSSSTAASTKWELTITSPDNWVTIAEWKITVAWNSKKNSKIQYFLNGKKVFEDQTENDWNFTYEMSWLDQNENIIVVKILDWNDSVIAESEKISVKLEWNWPVLNDVTVKEWKEVPAWSEINISVISDPELQEATASIWDFNQTLTEEAAWTYVWKLKVPAQAWDYQINLSLKSKLGKVTTKNNAFSIKTIEANIFKDIKTVIWDKKVTFTFDLTQEKPEVAKFKFKYGTWSESLTTEVVTFEREKIKNASWSLSWYIPNLEINKYYFQIYALDKEDKEISWIKSDVIDVDLSLSSAWKCMISNISWIKVTKVWDVSELTWNIAPEAISYNVYQKWADWKFSLIENVKSNKYWINISWDKVKYDDFAVKWVCWEWDNSNESPEYSEVTKVQTWPTQILAILWISLILGLFYIKRKKFN
ncbi:MAG: hypothetical protein ACD_4C00135G0008 [uncultured bacterium (gcode 4)]|uniref:Uncharacterized protein n=1 Tax=uncultured bacterium (gcode 4) TaxID=1234023 RepID=K2G9M7_9BACT|nr:MAG: hypothetical protein ACD_4C00135G0008 [uncultured bacterium (gcode 4)]